MRGKTRSSSSKGADRFVVYLKVRQLCTSLCNAQLRMSLIQRRGKAQVADSTDYYFDEQNQTETCRRQRQAEIVKTSLGAQQRRRIRGAASARRDLLRGLHSWAP